MKTRKEPNERQVCFCGMCQKVFLSDRPNEECIEELHENFGDVPIEECVVICDDCYRAITINGKPINWN